MKTKLVQTPDYLLFVDEEAEIKETRSFIGNDKLFQSDPDEWLICKCESIKGAYLMCNGVGYTKGYNAFSLIAYYPLTKEAKELDLPLLPSFEEVITDIAEKYAWNCKNEFTTKVKSNELVKASTRDFIAGYKTAQFKQFSLEDVKKAIEFAFDNADYYKQYEELKNNYLKSLSTQQLPKEFIPKFNKNTYVFNSNGKQELVGTYKY